MNEFGNFLYELRKEKGMTQQELADKLLVTNRAVSKWETGETFPETAQLVPLAGIFGVTVDELLRGERSAGTEGETAKTEQAHSADDAPLRGEHKDWARTRILLIAAAVAAVCFAALYLFSAVYTEEVAHRTAVIYAASCMMIFAVAVALCCILYLCYTQFLVIRAAPGERETLSRFRLMLLVGIVLAALGVCCFVFFSLFARPEYAHASALILGMTAGCVFALAGLAAAVYAAVGTVLRRRAAK